ncbi:MAG: hypothetical protein KME29_08430 [Calothrix sp. FI2-JRJ7]|nr:hypothetical protein [Calothrix sp. FI2-JRJ7]
MNSQQQLPDDFIQLCRSVRDATNNCASFQNFSAVTHPTLKYFRSVTHPTVTE